jgi:predicted Zn-dependent protease with MMP-like domain
MSLQNDFCILSDARIQYKNKYFNGFFAGRSPDEIQGKKRFLTMVPKHLPKDRLGQGRKQFEQWVREAVALLPRALRDRMENVVILVEDSPADEDRDWLDRPGELLGLYHGISQKERGVGYGNTLPDRIMIYRKPLERISSNRENLRENIRRTVFHEVGHYFGFDEEGLRRLEEDEDEAQ